MSKTYKKNMKHLIIKNVGPIKDIDVNLRRFNFIIGPQSSGKSTIAKVLSTCEWIEKEVAITRDEKAVADGNEFKNLVESFHKMEGFFDRKDSSYVLYETDYIFIEYNNKELTIRLNKTSEYNRQKICYIPAERNMITLPELSGFQFSSNNLRSFLFDWYTSREFYNKNNKTNILGLGVQYYFDKDETTKKDRIQHINGESYDISLSNSSSGLQSITPLLVILQYYTEQYFADFDNKDSFDQNIKVKKMRAALTKEIALELFKPGYSKAEASTLIAELNELIKKGDEWANHIYNEYDKACNRLLIPKKTTFIIEEPEQNLFPFTQVELLEYLINLCNKNREHAFTITTHSPFILNYINVLIMRYYKGISDKAIINPDMLAVYTTQNGRLVDLIQTNTDSSQKSVNTEDLVEAMRNMYSEYIYLKQK